MKRLTNRLMKKYYDIPEDLIKAFFLQGTYIRIKQLNDNCIAEQNEHKQFSKSDEPNKKLKKTIT